MGRGKVSDVRLCSNTTLKAHSALWVCVEPCCQVNTTNILSRPSLRSGRHHRHSIDMTGPTCSDSFKLCLDGLRLASGMFRNLIGPANGPIHDPIKHLRRGV